MERLSVVRIDIDVDALDRESDLIKQEEAER